MIIISLTIKGEADSYTGFDRMFLVQTPTKITSK